MASLASREGCRPCHSLGDLIGIIDPLTRNGQPGTCLDGLVRSPAPHWAVTMRDAVLASRLQALNLFST